jgi:hypothetical protein
MTRQQAATKARWATVLVAAASHPVLLMLLFPLVGERANWTMVLAPFAAAWLFSLWLSMVLLLLNAVSTSVVFAHLTHAGPREGLAKSAIAVFVVGMLCCGLDGIRRYLDRGRAMQSEIEKIHGSNRFD